MNAFPAELVHHHYACMLVAGLLPPQQQPARQGTTEPLRERQEERAEDEKEPIAGPSDPKPPTSTLRAPAEVFPQLSRDLCDIFSSRGRSTAWDPARARSAVFHSVLVDNNVRLPPRKSRPTLRTLTAQPAGQQNAASSLLPRSPLSPLHPSSPLFPDGLMAPIWLRKHRELVPSVFVAFYCLAEEPTEPPPTPPKNAPTSETSNAEQAKETEESSRGTSFDVRTYDEALIKAISDRKRILSERGIKLTVVLLTPRSMLDSSTLEQRLSYIRRSSQLDSKASLFVLTPVSRADLGDFVTSLQTALYEHALDYYRDHYRRVRRKRAKYPPPPATVSQILAVAAELRGSPVKDSSLSKEGWQLRSEYKLGTFAELIGNLDDAYTHYTNAYQMLSTQLLTSTLLLPPRTKRWAEAKVLADTLSLRIAKLLLYRNDGEGAWDQFRTHVRRFTELSQGWGIGEITFEFWSWLAKQYRLMGDLLDLAMREVPGSPIAPFQPSIHFPPMPTFLLHPSHLPTPTASGAITSSFNSQHGNLATPNEAAMASHVVPSQLCPGAGTCFYIAGICALERWERFKRLQWEEEHQHRLNTNSTPIDDAHVAENWSSSSLAQERKVDHAAQAIDALTRAHEVFKRQKIQRLALFVASKIANAYVDNQQSQLALRFLERTVKSYETERWPGPLVSQLLLAVQCAQETNDTESEARALLRLLGATIGVTAEQRKEAVEALEVLLREKAFKEEKRPLHVEWSKSDSPLDVQVVFGQSKTDLGEQAIPFQLRISASTSAGLGQIVFDRLKIHVLENDEEREMLVEHVQDEQSASKIVLLRLMDLRRIGKDSQGLRVGAASLTWSGRAVRVFEGGLIPRKVGRIQVSKITLESDGHAPLKLQFGCAIPLEDHFNAAQPHWLIPSLADRMQILPFQQGCGILEVKGRKHKLKVILKHESEAFLEEDFRIHVNIINEDDTPVDCQMDVYVLGPPGEVINTDEVWTLDNEEGTGKVSSLRDVPIERISPGSSTQSLVLLKCKKHLAERKVDIVVRTKAQDDADETDVANRETVTSSNISVKPIFSSNFYAQWRLLRDVQAISASRRGSSVPENEKVNESDQQSIAEEVSALSVVADELPYVTAIASLNVSITCLAAQEIQLLGVELVLDPDSKHLRFWQTTKASEQDPGQRSAVSVGGAWAHGDRWGSVFDVEVLSESSAGMAIEADDASLRSTGRMNIAWRRQQPEQDGTTPNKEGSNVCSLPLPLLLPPHLLARLIVSLPSKTIAEQPLVMLITIVNPSRLAADIVISIDDSRSDFGIQSHRTFTVPNLLPRSTRSVPVHLAPHRAASKGQASVRTVPSVRAWQRDRRQSAQTTESARTSIDSTPASVAAAGGAGATMSAHRQEELLKIVNQRSGAGVPLDVSLRYTTKTAGGVGAGSTSVSGGSVALPSTVAALAAAAATPPTASGESTEKTVDDAEAGGQGQGRANPAQQDAQGNAADIVTHLQAETQRTGLWTILVH